MNKIYLLLGEDAVREFEENGPESCRKKGFNVVDVIEYDDDTRPEDLVRETLLKVNGSLESIVINEEDYNIISAERKSAKKKK